MRDEEPQTPLAFAGFFKGSILEAMKRTLGEHGASRIAPELELDSIISDSHALHTRLLGIFGVPVAERLEQLIVSDLYLSLSVPYRRDDPINDLGDFHFQKCVDYGRKSNLDSSVRT